MILYKMFLLYIYILQALSYCSVLKLTSAQETVLGVDKNVLPTSTTQDGLHYNFGLLWNINPAYKQFWNAYLFPVSGRSLSLKHKETEIPERAALKRQKRRSYENKVKRDVREDSSIGNGHQTASVPDLDQSEPTTQIPVLVSQHLNLETTPVFIHNSTLLPQSSLRQNIPNAETSAQDDGGSDATTLTEGDTNAVYARRTLSEINSPPTAMTTGIIGSDASILPPGAMTTGIIGSDVSILAPGTMTTGIIDSDVSTFAQYAITGIIGPDVSTLAPNAMTTGIIGSDVSTNAIPPFADVASVSISPIIDGTNLTSDIISSDITTITPVLTGSEHQNLSTSKFNSENGTYFENAIVSSDTSSIANRAFPGPTTAAPTEPTASESTTSTPEQTFISTEIYRSAPNNLAGVGENVEFTPLLHNLLDSLPTSISHDYIFSEHSTPYILNTDVHSTHAYIEISSFELRTLSQDIAESTVTNIDEFVLGSSQTSLIANDVPSEYTSSPALIESINESMFTQNLQNSHYHSTRSLMLGMFENSITMAMHEADSDTTSPSPNLISTPREEISAMNIATPENSPRAPVGSISAEPVSSPFELSSAEFTALALLDPEPHSSLSSVFVNVNQIMVTSTVTVPAQISSDDFMSSIERSATVPGESNLLNPTPPVARMFIDNTTATPLFVSSPMVYTDTATDNAGLEKSTIFSQMDIIKSVEHTTMIPGIVGMDDYNSVVPSVSNFVELTALGTDLFSPVQHTNRPLNVSSSSVRTTVAQDATNPLQQTSLVNDAANPIYPTIQVLEITRSLHDASINQDIISSLQHIGNYEIRSEQVTGVDQDVTNSLHHIDMNQSDSSTVQHTIVVQDVTSSIKNLLQTNLLSLETEATNEENAASSSEQQILAHLFSVLPVYTAMTPVLTIYTNPLTVAPSSDFSAQDDFTISSSTLSIPIASSVDLVTRSVQLNALFLITADAKNQSAFSNVSLNEELTSDLSGTSMVLLPSTFDFQGNVLGTSEQYDTPSSLFSLERLNVSSAYVSSPTQGLEQLISRSRLINNLNSSQSLQDSLTTTPTRISLESLLSTSSIEQSKEISSYGILPSSSWLPSHSLQDITDSTFISRTEAFANVVSSSLGDSFTTNVPIELTTSFFSHSLTPDFSAVSKTSQDVWSTPVTKVKEMTTSDSSGIWHSLRPTKTMSTSRTPVLPPSYDTKYSASRSLTLSATHVIIKIAPSSMRRASLSSSFAPTHIVITTSPALKNVTIQFFYEGDCELVNMSPFKEELVIKLYAFFYELMKIEAKSINIGNPQCNPKQIIVSFRDVGKSALMASLRDSGVTPFTLGQDQNRIWFNITDFREVIMREDKTSNVGDVVLIIVALCICVTLVTAGIIIFFKEIYLKRGRRNINALTEAPLAGKKSTGEGNNDKYISTEMTDERSADESYCSPYDAEYSSIGNGEFTSFTTSVSCGSTPARPENGRSTPIAAKPKSKLQLRKPKRKSNVPNASGKYGLVVGLLGYKKPQVRAEAEGSHVYAVPEKNDLPIQHDYPEDHSYVNTPNPFRGAGSNGSLVRTNGAVKQGDKVVNSSREQLVANGSREQLVAHGSEEQLMATRPDQNVYNNCVYNAAFLSDKDPVTSSSFDSVHF